MSNERRMRKKEKRENQREEALRRGKIMSFIPRRRGIRQLPKPPIRIGIIMKKIIKRP